MRKITQKEILLSLAFATLGFAFSTREWLLFLNSLNPITGLVVYYTILYSSLILLSKAGLTIYKFRIDKPLQVLGLLLITFSFFILVGWSSNYVQYVTTGSTEGASVVFYQCEDGATFYFWYFIVGIRNIELARFFTFVFTPFTLTLLGSWLVTKPEIKA